MTSVNNITSTNVFVLNQLGMLINMGMIKGLEKTECLKQIALMPPCEIERLGSRLGDSFLNLNFLNDCLGDRGVDIPPECKALLTHGASNEIIQSLSNVSNSDIKKWREELSIPFKTGRIKRVIIKLRWPLWDDWIDLNKALTPDVLIELAVKYQCSVAAVWYEIITVASEKESKK
ncbi:MAG: hypothetical protein JKY50_19435 [Oleispira sp.]|nr:hypothetical protein [Oleispira sp.]